jgi:hypothetical protein
MFLRNRCRRPKRLHNVIFQNTAAVTSNPTVCTLHCSVIPRVLLFTHHIEISVCTSIHSRLSKGHFRSSCSSRERPLSGDELMSHQPTVTPTSAAGQARQVDELAG